jgi:dCMP deaminase|tara:strand:- start:1577 stop:2011 length:435 start_codon:yes stop_codon:yes gene_type:complete
MKTAHAFAECSTARRLQVGAIVVKDNRIISIGYNGMPSGWDNNCEIEVENEHLKKYPNPHQHHVIELKSKPEVLHAEMNALMKLARSTESGNGATMFITHSPCLDCAKGMHQAGIKEVYYEQEYRDDSGIKFLTKSGIQLQLLS